jgi:hypothetical protein
MSTTASQISKTIKAAFMPHFEQVAHTGLFMDGYYYRPYHQDSLSMAIEDAAVAVDKILHSASETAIRAGIRLAADAAMEAQKEDGGNED